MTSAASAPIERAALFIVLVLAAAIPARAHTTIVPDDFPTIQAGVNAIPESAVGETLLVRGGSYPEGVGVSRRSLVIQAIPPLDGSDRVPVIAGMGVGGPSVDCAFIGLRFTEQVTVDATDHDRLLFAGCRFDGNFYSTAFAFGGRGTHVIRLTRCTFYQLVEMGGHIATLDSNSVYGRVLLGPDSAFVLDNRFENVPQYSALTVGAGNALVARNRVRGGGAFEAYSEGNVRFEDNDIEGCQSGGIYSLARGLAHTRIERNRIAHCNSPYFRDYFGIRVQGQGTVRGNVVIDCSGPGIDVDQGVGQGAEVEDNVVGRCDVAGIRLTNPYADFTIPGMAPPAMSVRGNTVYACRGPGIDISYHPRSTIANNLVFACEPLSASYSDPLIVSHNDWFPASSAPGAPTDLTVDPVFCDLAADDVRLRSDSPLLDVPGVGRIGALGVGCEAPPVVIELELKHDVLPTRAHGGWVTAWLEPHAPFAASDIAIASVRLNGVPAAGDGLTGDRDRDGIPDLQLRFDREAVGQTLGRGAVATLTVTGTMRGRQFVGTDGARIPRGPSIGRPSDLDPQTSPPVLAIGAPLTIGVAGHLRVAFTLADASPARLEVLDVAGRVVLSQDVAGAGPGEHVMELGDRGRLAQGIYFLRLRQGGDEARTRAAVVR